MTKLTTKAERGQSGGEGESSAIPSGGALGRLLRMRNSGDGGAEGCVFVLVSYVLVILLYFCFEATLGARETPVVCIIVLFF